MSFNSNQLALRAGAGLTARQLKFAHCHCFGGDPATPTPNESMGTTMLALQRNLPGIMKAYSTSVQPYEQKLLDAQKNILPQQNQLQYDQYNQYAPQLNELGQRVNASNAEAQSRSDLNVLRGTGGKLTQAALDAQRKADPEYYKTREGVGAGFLNMLGGMDPNKLTGSESANVERGLNRLNTHSGNSNGGVPLNTISNAMTFGDELANKRQGYGAALGLGSQMLPTFKSGIDTFQLTTGRPSQTNPAAGQFLGVNQNSFGAQGQGMAGNVFNAASGFQGQANDINSQRRDSLDRFNQTLTANAGAVGSVCCFIFLQSLNGRLPWYLRVSRDNTYMRNPRVAKGYIRMSRWLVPLMDKSSLISNLVNELMVKPLVEHAAYLTGEYKATNRVGYAKFWLCIWRHS